MTFGKRMNIKAQRLWISKWVYLSLPIEWSCFFIVSSSFLWFDLFICPLISYLFAIPNPQNKTGKYDLLLISVWLHIISIIISNLRRQAQLFFPLSEDLTWHWIETISLNCFHMISEHWFYFWRRFWGQYVIFLCHNLMLKLVNTYTTIFFQ